MLEQILMDIQKADNEWNVILLRYFNPIGAHQSGTMGENPNGIPNNLMPYITQVAVGKLEQLGVFGDDYDTPDGTGVRDYIHVVDLAVGHVKALKKIEENAGLKIYNLGTGTGYSVLDIVKNFEAANDIKIPYVIKERRPGDIATCYCDPSKAESELGWKAQYGIKEMCTGELDFLKATVLSKSMEDVYMCSDMPMDDMAEIEDFPKKWMFGLALILKKGLHINIIHNLDRPFDEMMLGLEAWIPLYMTGQVSPYYLKGKHNTLYCRINYASGTAALSGECIAGHHNDGKYYVTKKPTEVNYYKNKAKLLFDKALPLMNVYKKENIDEFNTFTLKDISNRGNRTYIYSIPPLYTLNEDSLTQICRRSDLTSEEISTLLELRKTHLDYFNKLSADNKISIKLYVFSEDDFEETPLTLAISESFIEKDIPYTYKEYLEHVEATKTLSSNENVTIDIIETKGFKNLQIKIKDNDYAIVSKEKTPAIHFVMHHPKLVDALQNMVITYTD